MVGLVIAMADILGPTENAPDETVEGVDRNTEAILLKDLFRAGSNKNAMVH